MVLSAFNIIMFKGSCCENVLIDLYQNCVYLQEMHIPLTIHYILIISNLKRGRFSDVFSSVIYALYLSNLLAKRGTFI